MGMGRCGACVVVSHLRGFVTLGRFLLGRFAEGSAGILGTFRVPGSPLGLDSTILSTGHGGGRISPVLPEPVAGSTGRVPDPIEAVKGFRIVAGQPGVSYPAVGRVALWVLGHPYLVVHMSTVLVHRRRSGRETRSGVSR